MSSIRPLQLVARNARPSLSTVAFRPLAINQSRSVAGHIRGENDDLGGPGGQEPIDRTERSRQNGSLRRKTLVGMVLIGVPLFYMGKSRQAAKAQMKAKTAIGANNGVRDQLTSDR